MVYGQSIEMPRQKMIHQTIQTPPVLLIHGYMADASVWNKWVELLKKDGISHYPITFKQSDDKCGSAAEHAKELSKIIGQIKDETGQNKVNIVGHSKGGLDATDTWLTKQKMLQILEPLQIKCRLALSRVKRRMYTSCI